MAKGNPGKGYSIGYCKPPRNRRFGQPGGNRSGRKKGGHNRAKPHVLAFARLLKVMESKSTKTSDMTRLKAALAILNMACEEME